jgi:hypothetical protein
MQNTVSAGKSLLYAALVSCCILLLLFAVLCISPDLDFGILEMVLIPAACREPYAVSLVIVVILLPLLPFLWWIVKTGKLQSKRFWLNVAIVVGMAIYLYWRGKLD